MSKQATSQFRSNTAARHPKPLKRYAEKRDFTRTPEPSDKLPPKSSAKSLAFCIQKHLATQLHYDFRLEHNGVLLSWAVPKGPSLKPADKRLAMRIEDHPYDYKDFEGVIPSGYGAGVVMLWDQGAWSPEPGFENISASLAKGELKFTLHGVKLKGSWVLVRVSPKTPTGERERWLLIKHEDQWAGDIDITTFAPNSVKSDHDFEAIIKSNSDLWQSHKPATPDLQKIVDKVLALQQSPPPSQKNPRKRR